MSAIKALLEKERIEEIESRFASGDFDYIFLFTNYEAKAKDSNSRFYFQAYGDIKGCVSEIAVVDINKDICDCDECMFESPELDELVSIRDGLIWVLDKYGDTPIWLWVNSLELIDVDLLRVSTLCKFQLRLIDEIETLLGKFDIRVDEYTYANKDMIPVLVEGKTLTGIVEG